mgnify:CR=1 FL=1
MKKNCFKNIWLASAAAFVFAFSASANVGAWNNDPFASQATSETSAAAGDVITNPTTEQTAPDAAIDDIEPETTDSEDIEEEIPTEETTTTQEVVIAPASSASEEITTQPPQPSAPSYAPTDSYTMYAPQVINVRSGPGTDYDKLGVVYANSAVTVVGSSGDWLAVSYNGQTGFILASLLSDTQPQTTTSAAPAATEPQQTEETTVSETEAETSAPESIDEEPITNPVTQAPQTSETAQTSRTEAAAAVDNTGEGGFPPILLALICAVAAFLIVAVIPIAVLRIRHRNLYRY